jgi:6-phosphofructokinase 1
VPGQFEIAKLRPDRLVHVPIGVAAERRNRVDPEGALWRDVVNDTGQPLSMTNG